VEQVVNPITPLEDDDDPFLVRSAQIHTLLISIACLVGCDWIHA
jgi:hypothetical protein